RARRPRNASAAKRAASADRRLLPPEAQARDERPVALDVLAPQVVQQPPAAPDHLQQAAPGVVVLLVRLQVLREVGDALGENGDLDLGRAGIGVAATVLLDDLGFLLFYQCHCDPW